MIISDLAHTSAALVNQFLLRFLSAFGLGIGESAALAGVVAPLEPDGPSKQAD